MAIIRAWQGSEPKWGTHVFIAENATLVGDVTLADEVSVWYGAVLRADVGSIQIGKGTNIQDLACVHLTGGISKTVIGANVTVGHGAIIHGATVGDGALIGMGAIILDNAVIGAQSIVAAGAVVPPRAQIPPRSLVRGNSAKVVRELDDAGALQGAEGAAIYRDLAREQMEQG